MAILNDYVKDISVLPKNLIAFIDARKRQIEKVIKNCTELSVKEVRPGGSYKKKTMLNYKLDIDIVFIINKTKGKDWGNSMAELFTKLRTNCKNAHKIKQGNNIAVYVQFTFEKSIINFDIVLSFPLNSPNQTKDHVGEKTYQGGTTIWQIEYLNAYKGKQYFTDIVILLKDWKAKNKIPFLKSFHIELLVAFVYGRYSNNFNGNIETILKICFCKIHAMLDGKPIIPINWKHSKKMNYKRHYTLPYMIDPGNLHDNLLSELERDQSKIIRKNVSKSLTFLLQKDYEKIFKPEEKYFFKSNVMQKAKTSLNKR